MSATSLALSNLRAIVILIVLGFHSIMGYLGSLPSAAASLRRAALRLAELPDHRQPALVRLRPVLRMERCLPDVTDVLPVRPVRVAEPARKNSVTFLSDRLLRLGLPMIPAIFVLMPIALYPVYLVTAADPSLADYWRQFQALPFWPCGPQWFLWQLLILNIVAAGASQGLPELGRASRQARGHRPAPIRSASFSF